MFTLSLPVKTDECELGFYNSGRLLYRLNNDGQQLYTVTPEGTVRQYYTMDEGVDAISRYRLPNGVRIDFYNVDFLDRMAEDHEYYYIKQMYDDLKKQEYDLKNERGPKFMRMLERNAEVKKSIRDEYYYHVLYAIKNDPQAQKTWRKVIQNLESRGLTKKEGFISDVEYVYHKDQTKKLCRSEQVFEDEVLEHLAKEPWDKDVDELLGLFVRNTVETVQYNGDNKHYVQVFLPTGAMILDAVRENWKLEGLCRTYYLDGTIRRIANYREDKFNGYFVQYYHNGFKQSEGYYYNNLLEGIKRKYNRYDGSLYCLTDFVKGVAVHKEYIFDCEGNLVCARPFKNGHVEGEVEFYYPFIVSPLITSDFSASWSMDPNHKQTQRQPAATKQFSEEECAKYASIPHSFEELMAQSNPPTELTPVKFMSMEVVDGRMYGDTIIYDENGKRMVRITIKDGKSEGFEVYRGANLYNPRLEFAFKHIQFFDLLELCRNIIDKARANKEISD